MARSKEQRGFLSYDTDWVLAGLTLIFLAVLGFAIWGAVENHRAWLQFASQHHCRVISRMEGDSGTGVGTTSKGDIAVVTTSTSDKTAYECDDGVIYWRDE